MGVNVMTKEPKPCPFCGSEEYVHIECETVLGIDYYSVKCGVGMYTGCGARSTLMLTDEGAVSKWNARAQTEREKKLEERCKLLTEYACELEDKLRELVVSE